MTSANPTPGSETGRANISRVTWRGREAMRIANDAIHLVVLAQGGVLADFGLENSRTIVAENAFWESDWFSEPSLPSDDNAIIQAYGDLGAGRFLNRYTGHALCLDGFGPASREEVRAGAGLHGEAILVDWELQPGGLNRAIAKAHLPLAQLAVERRFCLESGESVVRIEERVTNLGTRMRALHWVQHATVGPPMFDEASIVSASVSEGVTWPYTYEGVPLLKTDAPFVWPHAPNTGGDTLDLSRLFSVPGAGFVAAARQAPGRRFGFVAALNQAKQIALIYLFSANIFPWVTFWEENCCRSEWPWKGSTQARGLEFGTTPLPLGNLQVDAAGPLLHTPTSLPLRAGATVCAPWLMAITQVPAAWCSVDDITVEQDRLIIRNADETVGIEAPGIEAFLSTAGELT